MERIAGSKDALARHGTITALLLRHGRGEDEALASALTVAYGDLLGIARRCMANERPTPTFDDEALAHEAYLRLVSQDRTQWQDRRHLFAIAVRIMRRILVDRARARRVAKRGGPEARATTFDGKPLAAPQRSFDVLRLDDALQDLATHDPSLAQLVELRFFGGLTNSEIAELQGVTSMTIIRRWRLARAWLERYLKHEEST